MKIYISRLLAVLLSLTSLKAQFIEATVQIDIERLNQNEQQQIVGLKQSIIQFFVRSDWGDDVKDLDMIVDVHMALQSTVTVANEENFQAQIMFTNRLDQQLFVKDAKFPYYPGRTFDLAGSFDQLTSVLSFYGYMLIAGELDTYGQLEGSPYYAMANSVAATASTQPRRGSFWKGRLNFADELTQNQDGRRAKAYFYQALDALAAEKPDHKLMQAALQDVYTSIGKIVNRVGLDRTTAKFLNGHAEELAEMLTMARMWTELENMMVMNPDSQKIYKDALESK